MYELPYNLGMLLGVIIIITFIVVFIFAVVWLVKTESRLDSLQTKKLEELRNHLKLQYCDEWFPLIYDADSPQYGRGLPAPFHIKNILTVDLMKKTFELYTVVPEGENVHKSVPFSAAKVNLPDLQEDFKLGLNIRGLDFISPKLIRPSEPVVSIIKTCPASVVNEFSKFINSIIVEKL